ncbi:hypothetical protein G7Y89_g11380 [Cudoniella acicularis]|uniref:F-box domain-containing protein n=1 Tax=Cudoniella acicularis TaxID=354080 RepID=A0A8H4RAY5_9HELO|nr:hypothetical protein G7Y89_g11380 [Cudoniella acicularis]
MWQEWDILRLFGRFEEDGYGRDLVSSNPISFSQVTESRPRASAAALFRFPSEILGIILSYIDSSSLGSLALVNSDCRQLARSRQFAGVCFDYSPATSDLISKLLEENTERTSSGNSVNRGAICPCIRRLNIATDSVWLTHFHDIEVCREFRIHSNGKGSIKDSEERLSKATDAYNEYVKRIQSLLSSRTTLPHLELVDWQDTMPVPRSFFTSLVTSRIQHLRLRGVFVVEEFEIDLPPQADTWELRTLLLDIKPSPVHYHGGATSPVCASLLRSCSHSLETLIWYFSPHNKFTFGTDSSSIPQFDKLRDLSLRRLEFGNNEACGAFLEAPLSCLDLSYNYHSPALEQSLRQRGCIPSLEILAFSLSKDSIDGYFEFLKANTQLSKLSIEEYPESEGDVAGDAFEEKILPLLSSSFKTIKSLKLIWKERTTVIPDAALAMISGMETLEQLCLGTGPRCGSEYSWLIDHESMRKHLSLLPKLCRIAFHRDSYQDTDSSVDDENDATNYYKIRSPSIESMRAAGIEVGDKDAETQFWEDGHKARMIIQAEKYIASMPKLEGVYIGQYLMYAAGDASAPTEKRQAVLLRNERDPCSTLLSYIFSREGVFFG